MSAETSRTPEKIFSAMHRELRTWNRDIPESPDRMDPILRIMLKLFASQLAEIDKKIEDVWKNAGNSLIRALCPESRRWPVPAFTVIRAKPTDQTVELDPQTRFFHKEERADGQTFFFSAKRMEKLVNVEVKHIYFKSGRSILDLSPRTSEITSTHDHIGGSVSMESSARIYIGLEHSGPSTDFEHSSLYIRANSEALKILHWSKWQPGNSSGQFSPAGEFCPGQECSLEKMFTIDGEEIDWGGLRKSGDIFKSLEYNFVVLPGKFINEWSAGPVLEELKEAASEGSLELPSDNKKLFWIALELPEGGDRSAVISSFNINFDCFIAVNKNELTLFKHTGGNRLVKIEIPENIDNILEIIGVSDSNGQAYFPHHEIFKDGSRKFYSLEETGDRLVLWFDYSGEIEMPPDSITVNYSVTAGVDANGIEAGKINELYENHPGIIEGENIIQVSGAVPAKTEQQIIAEVSARLRNRDRALSFNEIANWSKTFDPRISDAVCRNGIERTSNGVRRCIVVEITVRRKQFYSEDEIILLKTRLSNFLKERSTVNSQYKVEIISK
jgi:hypothetical protein